MLIHLPDNLLGRFSFLDLLPLMIMSRLGGPTIISHFLPHLVLLVTHVRQEGVLVTGVDT